MLPVFCIFLWILATLNPGGENVKKCILLFMLAFLCSGCTQESPPAYRVVTGIEVVYVQNGNELHRSYTSTESIQHLLNYLRLLNPREPGLSEIPTPPNCHISLQYSYGPDCNYYLSDNQYLCRDDGLWLPVNPAQAQLLYPTLLLLPSDG